MANVKYLGERTIREGEEIMIVDLGGDYAMGELLTVVWLDSSSRKGFRAKFCLERSQGEGAFGHFFSLIELELEKAKYFTLILGACRPQMLKRIFEVAPTLPIKNILIVATERTEKSYLSSRILREGGYLKYLEKGVEQGGIPYLPEVQVIDKFWTLGERLDFSEGQERILCNGNSDVGIGSLGAGCIKKEGGTGIASTLVAVGPEGGWSEGELAAFKGWGFTEVHLGSGILRVDVAVISALSTLRRDIY